MSPDNASTRRDAPDGLPRGEMPALTSIRALLAWWVVAFHFAPSEAFHVHFDPVLSKGRIAVDCFFVLSGFVLCHVHPAIIGSKRPRATADFLVSRLARIYPMHLFMLAAFAAVVVSYRMQHDAGYGAAHGVFTRDTTPALIRQVLLLHGWFGADSGAWNVPSWSISSEWGAYLLAPLIFLWLGRIGTASLLAGLGICGVAVVYFIETGEILKSGMQLPRVLLEFMIGGLLRTLLAHGAGGLRRIRSAGLWLAWPVAAGLAFSRHEGVFLVVMVWIMLLLSLRTRRAGGWWRRTERITIYLGETSFAVYMGHAFILMLWAGKVFPRLQQVHLAHDDAWHRIGYALMLALVVQGFASALHHGLELPAQSWIRRRFRASAFVTGTVGHHSTGPGMEPSRSGR